MTSKSKLHWYLVTLILFVGGVLAWQCDLTADPPLYFSGRGQSLTTDPYVYTYHARNKILFGESNPYDDRQSIVLETLLVSLSAYVWFSLTEPSREQANRVGVFLSLGGLLVLMLALARHHSPWVCAALAVCYLTNVALFTYGRLPYLENGLIFLVSLVFFVYSRWGARAVGVGVSGALISVAMLGGKPFGALLLPAVMLTIIVSHQKSRWKHVTVLVVSFVVSSVGLLVLLYAVNPAAAQGYLSWTTYNQHGIPSGLASPWVFVERLVAYGFDNALYLIGKDLVVFLGMGGLLTVYYLISRKRNVRPLAPTTILAAFWTVMFTLGLILLDYSPHRYGLLIVPAVLILFLTLIDSLKTTSEHASIRLGKGMLVVVVLCFWLPIFHAVVSFLYYKNLDFSLRPVVWLTLPVAIAAAFATKYLAERRNLRVSRRGRIIVLLVVLALSLAYNGWSIRYWHLKQRIHSISEANADLGQILGEGALVSGPYAQTLVCDTRLKSHIHFFGSPGADSTLFSAYPVTHLAVDERSWKPAVEINPALKALNPLASYWIRDHEIHIYSISKFSQHPQARAYVESPYERAVAYFQAAHDDSALVELLKMPVRIDESKSAGLLFIMIKNRQGDLESVRRTFTTLADRFETDYFIQFLCGQFLHWMATASGDLGLLRSAQEYYRRAAALNPYKAEQIQSVFQEIRRQGGR